MIMERTMSRYTLTGCFNGTLFENSLDEDARDDLFDIFKYRYSNIKREYLIAAYLACTKLIKQPTYPPGYFESDFTWTLYKNNEQWEVIETVLISDPYLYNTINIPGRFLHFRELREGYLNNEAIFVMKMPKISDQILHGYYPALIGRNHGGIIAITDSKVGLSVSLSYLLYDDRELYCYVRYKSSDIDGVEDYFVRNYFFNLYRAGVRGLSFTEHTLTNPAHIIQYSRNMSIHYNNTEIYFFGEETC